MIEEIKKVLKRYADLEVNLSSEAAREMVAKEIEKEITKKTLSMKMEWMLFYKNLAYLLNEE